MEKMRDSQIQAICNPYQERLRIICILKKNLGDQDYTLHEKAA